MKEVLTKIDKFLEDIFLKKAPGLSSKAKEAIVKVLPWLILVFSLMALPGIFTAFGLSAVASPFWVLSGRRFVPVLFNMMLSSVEVVLGLMAVPKLLKKDKKGWQLVFYSMLLGVVGTLFSASGFGLVISGVFLYLLYQVKGSYK